MLVNHNGIPCHILKIKHPHRIWYHININLLLLGEDYIAEKLGVTDPAVQHLLQDEFYEAAKNYKKSEHILLDRHSLRYDKTYIQFYLADITPNSVTVYIETSLLTLFPNKPNGMKRPPLGCPWAVIHKSDTPEIIRDRLYHTYKSFGEALHRKLKKIMGW